MDTASAPTAKNTLVRTTSASLKKVKAKDGYCMAGHKEPCKNNDSVKKKDWCRSCGTYTDKYLFYDFEATQNTGTHTINLSIAQDFEGNECTCTIVRVMTGLSRTAGIIDRGLGRVRHSPSSIRMFSCSPIGRQRKTRETLGGKMKKHF